MIAAIYARKSTEHDGVSDSPYPSTPRRQLGFRLLSSASFDFLISKPK